MIKIKPPTLAERLKAKMGGEVLCARCALPGRQYIRPKQCPHCAARRRRLQDVKEWLRRRGMPGV